MIFKNARSSSSEQQDGKKRSWSSSEQQDGGKKLIYKNGRWVPSEQQDSKKITARYPIPPRRGEITRVIFKNIANDIANSDVTDAEKERAIERAKQIEKEIEEETKKESVIRALYTAILSQEYGRVESVLRSTTDVSLRDKITIIGNTALHVAVGTCKKKEFLDKIFDLATQGEQPPLNMQNSEGSTLLHVAAIVGNTEAAKILVKKNNHLLYVKDNEGHTPVARALSNMHNETYLYLLNISTTDIEQGDMLDSIGDLLANMISSKDYSSALFLVLKSGQLSKDIDTVLLAIAQNFPPELNFWESIVHDRLSSVRKSSEETGNLPGQQLTKDPFSSVGDKKVNGYTAALLKFKFFEDTKRKATAYWTAKLLLQEICLKSPHPSNSNDKLYNNVILEATRQDACEVVETIVSYFPDAIWSTNTESHNIIQYAVINRSEKVYNLLYQMSEHKNIYKTIKDPSDNNLLHLAAKLAPPEKLSHISGAALQIQRELQWFKEVEGFVCPLNITQKNKEGDTPQQVFTREHNQLVIDGEKWMKETAQSYTITAALITTIVFAAAITVPGGNTQDGIPMFTNKTAFKIFAISDAISLFTSVTSLLMFLSILTARYSEKDFLFKLPTTLIIGLANLFISTTAMLVAFGATLFLVFGKNNPLILVPIAVLTCLPVASFVTLQFPLVVDLMGSTYGRSIFGKKSDDPFY